MNKALIVLSVLVIVVTYTSVNGQEFMFKDIKVSNNPNSVLGEWSANVKDGAAYVKTPIKERIPEDTTVDLTITVNGNSMPIGASTLCEVFAEPMIGKEIVKAGIPDGIFPTSCPIEPNENYEITNFKMPNEKIPPGMMAGKVEGSAKLIDANGKILVSVDFEGELSPTPPISLGR